MVKSQNTPKISDGNKLDLFVQEVLQNDNSAQKPIEFIKEIPKLRRIEAVAVDEDLSKEQVLDLQSNRDQREKFTRQIIVIMCAELIFIAILILGVFITPFINSLAPKISLNCPPLFITLTLFSAYIYLYKQVTIFSKKVKFWIRMFATAILLFLLNYFARDYHAMYFDTINLAPNLINMILYTSLAVFVKTTFLAGYIIKGLYDALNRKK